MSVVRKPANKSIIEAFLSKDPEQSLTWIETHGLIAAMAVGPEASEGWQELCYSGDEPIPSAVAQALEKQRVLFASTIAGEEGLQPPCLLDPYAEDEGNDLASWCMGFVSGMLLNEALWHPEDRADVSAQLLLPMILIAGLDEDPELDELWENEKMVRQMAVSIPALMEELYLFYHAPDESNK